MSCWNAKYPNDCGEYEITFGSKTRETTKAVEKVCTAVMDGLVKSPDDIEIIVHAHWEDEYGGKYANPRYRCSACKEKALYRLKRDVLGNWKDVQALTARCPHCGAHMDEEVAE